MSGSVLGDSSLHETGPFRSFHDKSEEPSGGGRWYLSRKEIEETSSSRLDGIDLKKETYLRKSYCTFLQDLGMRLKVPQLTIATAIIFCHRFFLRQSHAKNDRRTIATVCMFLAGKVEETPRPLKDVILVSYEIINKKDSDAVQRIKQKEVYEQQKELILTGERVVLATLGFDLNLIHPYKPLVDAIKKFKVAQNALAQVAWNFVNDGLRTSLCLQFKPHHIAAGAIFLAAKFLKVKLPSDGEKVWWQEFDVTPRQLEEVSNQMLELYEQNRVPPSTNSEAEESTVGGAAHRTALRASSGNEDHATTNGQPVSRSGYEQPLQDNDSGQPTTAQSQGNDYGSAEMKNASDHNTDADSRDYLQCGIDLVPSLDKIAEAKNISRLASDGLGKVQEKNVERSEINHAVEMKDKHLGRAPEHRECTLGQSPRDAISKIDRDKVKAALEKRKKSRVDITRKTDLLNEDDLIERELEDGIEMAAESEKNKHDRRQSWSKPTDRQEYENPHYGKHQLDSGEVQNQGLKAHLSQKAHLSNMEDGEVSVPDDMNQGFHSPKSSNRKRKAWSPPDEVSDAKQSSDDMAGSHHYSHHDHSDDRNRGGRHGYLERDHKRRVPENQV